MTRDCYAHCPGDEKQYVTHSLIMRKSPAWRTLPYNARRILERLELEHMNHRGQKNGALIVTYDQLMDEAGLRKGSLLLAIRQAAALGFLEVVRKGYPARANLKMPNIYRLTYVDCSQAAKRAGAPHRTDEWKEIKTPFEARQALSRAKTDLDHERAIKWEGKQLRKTGKSSSGLGATVLAR